MQHGMPDSIGVMSIKTANRTILEASLLPTPRALWDSFWYEGELSCLFADSNVGKSILAVQIADRIARTDNVLYLDFELSEKQFQLRYTNEHGVDKFREYGTIMLQIVSAISRERREIPHGKQQRKGLFHRRSGPVSYTHLDVYKRQEGRVVMPVQR